MKCLHILGKIFRIIKEKRKKGNIQNLAAKNSIQSTKQTMYPL